MAIHKVDPKAIRKIICASDEAVDEKASDLEKYAETLDQKYLVMRPNITPTYFHLKHIKNSEQAGINGKFMKFDMEKKKMEHKNVSSMFLELFDACVVKMETDGVAIDVTSDELPYEVVQEVGSYCMVNSSLNERLKKT